MSKIAIIVLAIVAVSAIMGTSMISADAAGKPTKIENDQDLTFDNQRYCATVSTLEVNRHTSFTIDGEGDTFKISWTFKGVLIDNDDEVIGTYHAKNHRVGAFGGDGTFTGTLNTHINCLNGEKNENIHSGFTITKDGDFHSHGP